MENLVVSQLFGIVAMVSVVLAMQFKNMKTVLVFTLLSNVAGGLSYLFSGERSGFGLYVVGIVQSLVYFVFQLKSKKAPLSLGIGFIGAYMLCSVITYSTYWDIFSAVAALTCALAIIQEKASMYRLYLMFNGMLWTGYDIGTGAAFSMMISHIITFMSSLFSIIRLDIKR